jgi:hypothetical protein
MAERKAFEAQFSTSPSTPAGPAAIPFSGPRGFSRLAEVGTNLGEEAHG